MASTPAVANHPAYTGFGTRNGSTTDKYRWSQSKSDVSVEITLPGPVETASDVSVHLTASSVSVNSSSFGPLLSEEFYDTVHLADSWWALEDKRSVILTLEKKSPSWWKSLVKGGEEIDVTKVDSSVRMEELSEESRSAVHKILLEQSQTRTSSSV